MKKYSSKFYNLTIISILNLTVGLCGSEIVFDGKTLNGWTGSNKWTVEDGAITGSIPQGKRLKKNEFIYLNEKHGDFELSLDYKITGPHANSGIQIRSTKDKNGHAVGYQADLDNGRTWLGRIYDEHCRGLIVERGTLTMIDENGKRHSFPFRDARKMAKIPKQNDWNHYKIIAKGNRIEIHINGIHFSTLEDYEEGQADLSGFIALQLHSGKGPAKIQFKNISVKKLKTIQKTQKIIKKESGIVPPEMPNIGFENGDLTGWTVQGDAFENQPVKAGTIEKRLPSVLSNTDGIFFLGGYEHHLSDHGTGTLSSKPFKVTHDWAQFRIGGGSGNSTRVEIVLSESKKVIAKFSGKNNEAMSLRTLNLSQFKNQQIFIRIVDNTKGSWGHINFDDFRFYAKKPIHDKIVARKSPLLKHLNQNPTEDLSHMFVPEGFQVDLVASEPQVRQPIAFTFDAKGRIWVAEALAYPRRKPEGKGQDRLIILEDKDGDGKFETHKVFADNLNLISGFEIGYGGVWVGAAPELLFIPDRDGDDVPDGKPKVILDGWDTRDTHETPNSFMWGHDGWLYGNHGVFNDSYVGAPETPKEDRILVRAAVWRLHPVTHKFEIYAHGGSNQWGLDYNAHGAMFMTHCRSSWGRGPVSQVLRDGHYWTQNNLSHADFIATASKGWNYVETPVSNYLKSVAAYGHGEGGAGSKGSRAVFGGHSHVGAMVYLGNNWPEEYRHQLYTHNLHGQRLNRENIQQYDSAFLSHSYGRDQLYVKDKEYLAVDLKYGPDGAVYSIDWDDKQHCHSNKEIWNKTNGSVYRMSWKATYEPTLIEDISKVSDKKLVEYLSHENEWFSRMAQHILRQRAANGEVKKQIQSLIRQKLFDTNSKYRFRALIALYGVQGISDNDYVKLLNDENETLRSQAVYFITEQEKSFSEKFANQLIAMAQDKSAMVRLTLAGACQKRLNDNTALAIINKMSLNEVDANDRFIPKMLWFAYSKFAKADLKTALETADNSKLPLFRRSIYWYTAKHDLNLLMKKLASVNNNRQLLDYLNITKQALGKKKLSKPPLSWDKVSMRASKIQDAHKVLNQLKTNFGESGSTVTSLDEKIALGKASFAICAACHSPGKDLPGPSLEEIASVYDNKQDIINWLIKPGKKRENYPQMPPFDKMDKESLENISLYLLSLKK